MRDPLLQALLSATEPSATDPNCQLRFGTVTQVSPLLVKVGASTVGQPCGRAARYSPIVNDYVAVLVNGPDRMVIASMLADPHSGVSGSRPTSGNFVGDQYVDSSLAQVFYWDGAAWRGTKSKNFGTGAGALTTSGTTQLTLCTLAIPDQKCAGTAFVSCTFYSSAGTPASGDIYEIGISIAASQVTGQRIGFSGLLGASEALNAAPSGTGGVTAGSSTNVVMTLQRLAGSGNAGSNGDPRYANLSALWIPN